MKKHLYLMPVLALSMAAFALAGCDDKKDEQAAAPTGEVTAESAMPTAAETPVAATIAVSDAVAYATAIESTNGAVFATLQNPQTASDTLTGATSDVSESVEIHETKAGENGTMAMSQVDSIEILAGQHVRLSPDGYHLMLINLKAPLTEGQTFNVTLNFTNAGAVTVPVTVVAAGSDTTDAHEDHGDGAAATTTEESTVPVDEAPVVEETPADATTPDAATTDTAPADSGETTAE